jgi:hypothetical protein
MADTISVTVRRFDSAGFAVRLHCKYTPGSPAKGPSFECAGGEPEDPDDIVVEAWTVVDAGCDVAEVLSDQAGIDLAVREAVAYRPDEAACWAEDHDEEARS